MLKAPNLFCVRIDQRFSFILFSSEKDLRDPSSLRAPRLQPTLAHMQIHTAYNSHTDKMWDIFLRYGDK